MKMRTFYKKTTPFYNKNYIDPTYKKLKPQISPFIKNSIFGNNIDPHVMFIIINTTKSMGNLLSDYRQKCVKCDSQHAGVYIIFKKLVFYKWGYLRFEFFISRVNVVFYKKG